MKSNRISTFFALIMSVVIVFGFTTVSTYADDSEDSFETESEEKPVDDRSGLNYDWENRVAGKDYVENEVLVTFNDDLEDQSIVNEIAAFYNYGIRKISWRDRERGKKAVFIIGENETVKDAIAKIEENEFVQYARPNLLYRLDDSEESLESDFDNKPVNDRSGLNYDWENRVAGKDYVENEVIVTFNDDLEDQNIIYEVAALYGYQARSFIWENREHGKTALFIISEDESVREAIERIEENEFVQYAEVNPLCEADTSDKLYVYVCLKGIIEVETVEEFALSYGCSLVSTTIIQYEEKTDAQFLITDGATVDEKITLLSEDPLVLIASTKPILYTNDPPGSYVPDWERLAGSNRYGTMQAISNKGWADSSCETVIVATGGNFPDALAGSSLAGLYECPLILTKTDKLSAQAAAEIKRLGAKKIIILGSAGAVSKTTEKALKEIVGNSNVLRLEGSNRYGTGDAIYKAGIGSWSDTLILVTGASAPDALSISPYAFASQSPIALVKNGNKLSETIESAVKAGSFSKAIIIGGTNVVGSDIEDWVMKQIGYENVLRLSGSNRYKTSSQIADWVSGKMTGARFQPSILLSYINVGVANGANDHFPDALSGGALCGHNKAVLLLAKDSIYNNNFTMTQNYMPNKETVKTGFVLGGESVLSDDFLLELKRGDFSKKEIFVKPS